MSKVKEDLNRLVIDEIKPADEELVSNAFLKGDMMEVPTTSSSTTGTCTVEIQIVNGSTAFLIRDWMSGYELMIVTGDDDTVSYIETNGVGTIESDGTVEVVEDLRILLSQFCNMNA